MNNRRRRLAKARKLQAKRNHAYKQRIAAMLAKLRQQGNDPLADYIESIEREDRMGRSMVSPAKREKGEREAIV